MKKVINILLAICIVAMVYIVYGSIMGPIKFANEKGTRDWAVIQKLMDIKAAQTEYNNQNGTYWNSAFGQGFFSFLDGFIHKISIGFHKKIKSIDEINHLSKSIQQSLTGFFFKGFFKFGNLFS